MKKTTVVAILRKMYEGQKLTQNEMKLLQNAQSQQSDFSKTWLRKD